MSAAPAVDRSKDRPVGGGLRPALVHQLLEEAVCERARFGWPLLPVANAMCDVAWGAPRPRPPTVQQLQQHHRIRVHLIRLRELGLFFKLLRGLIRNRPRSRAQRAKAGGASAHVDREPKIGELGDELPVSAVEEQHIVALEVVVQNGRRLRVQEGHAVRDARRQPQLHMLLAYHGAGRDVELGPQATLWRAFEQQPDVVDLAQDDAEQLNDIRVHQLSQRAEFALRILHSLRALALRSAYQTDPLERERPTVGKWHAVDLHCVHGARSTVTEPLADGEPRMFHFERARIGPDLAEWYRK